MDSYLLSRIRCLSFIHAISQFPLNEESIGADLLLLNTIETRRGRGVSLDNGLVYKIKSKCSFNI